MSPGWLARETVPPWAVTIAWTRARPRPAPESGLRVRAPSPRVKRSKACGGQVGREAGPVVAYVEPVGAGGHGDGGAGRGVLAGVGEQVGDDLVQPLPVAGELDHVVGQVEAPPVIGRDHPGVRHRLEEQPGQVDAAVLERAPGVEPGQQQQVLDEVGHPAGLLVDLGQGRLGGLGVLGSAAGKLGVAGDRRERGPQLVRRVRHELPDLLLAAVPRAEGASRRAPAACSARTRPGRPRSARR